MFEDLINKDNKKGIIWGQKPVSRDSVIKAMKQNIKDKDKLIKDLVDELTKIQHELDYLRNL